jgi:MFS family permease
VLAWLANAMFSLAAFLFLHFPGFLQALGAGEAQIGWIMSIQAAGAIVTWPVVGRLMDSRGRRLVILCGGGLFVAVVALYLPIRTLGPYVYVVRLLDGIATAMWYTALFTYGADLVPPQRRIQGLALFGTSGLLPIGLGALFGDVILYYATYRELFLGALGFSLLGFVACLPLRDVFLVRHEAQPRGVLVTAAQPNLMPIWLASLTFFIAAFALSSFMKTFVIAGGVGTVGGFYLAYAAVAVLLRMFLGWLPDRVGVKRMLGIAMSVYALGLIVLSSSRAPWHVLTAGMLCGAGHGYTFPVLFSLVITRARFQERGAAMASFTALDWVGRLIAGPMLGVAIEGLGYRTSFLGLAALLAAGGGMFYGLDRTRRHARAAVDRASR